MARRAVDAAGATRSWRVDRRPRQPQPRYRSSIVSISINLNVNGVDYPVDDRSRSQSRQRAAHRDRPDRHQGRLRRLRMRRVHGVDRRSTGQLVLLPRRAGRRPADHDHRGRDGRRRPASTAAGTARRGWRAVRVLHTGDDHVGARHCSAATHRLPKKRSASGCPATCAAAPATPRSSPPSSVPRPKDLATAAQADRWQWSQ